MSYATTTHKPPAFYEAACNAVVQYAREHARLPAFGLLHPCLHPHDTGQAFVAPALIDALPLARMLTFGAGMDESAIAPRADNTWLTLQPLDDLHGDLADETMRALLTKRVRFMRLLVRLARNAELFPLDPGIDCVGDTESESEPLYSARNFWWRLLHALAPDAVWDATRGLERNLVALSHGQRLRILVSVNMNLSGRGVAQALTFLFTALAQDDQNDHDDHDHDEAYAQVLATCGLTPSSSPLLPASPVDMGIAYQAGRVSRAIMTTILEGMARTHAPSSSLFCVRSLWFELDCILAPTAAEILGERLQSQPRIELDALEIGSTRDVLPRSLRYSLVAVVTTVRRFVMQDRDGSIGAIASALRTTEPSPLQELALEFSDVNRDLAEWLAFALFHVDSQSQVASLSLCFQSERAWLTPAWLAQFKDILRGAVLPGSTTTTTAALDGSPLHDSTTASLERRFVKLATNSAVKCAPYNGRKSAIKVSDAETEWEALHEADGKLAVVVPGVGIGWVPLAAVVHRHTKPSQLPPVLKTNNDEPPPIPINQRVTTLAWSGPPRPSFYRSTQHADADSHARVLLDLLAVIGKPLTRLSLLHMRLANGHITRILELCPNLTELDIHNNPRCDLTPFVAAHEAGHLDKLASLRIDWMQPANGHAPLVPWVEQLTQWLMGERPSRLARLVVHVYPLAYYRQSDHLAADVLLPLITFFKTMGTLEHVELRVPTSVANCLAPVDRAPTAIVSNLSLRKKLAFLSVVQTSQSAMARLDAAVLSLVLQYCSDTTLLFPT